MFNAFRSSLLFLSVFVVGEVVADTINLAPVADTTLYESADGSLSNGSGQYFFAGVTLRDNQIRRALLRFDLRAIPPNSRVCAASLTLHMSRTSAGPQTLTVHAARRGWGEGASDAGGDEGGGTTPAPGDVTWIEAVRPGTLWTTPGGDFSPTPVATASIGGIGFYAIAAGPDFLALIRSWLTNPALNNGVLLRVNESTNGTAKRFDSRENPDGSVRPVLQITYTCPSDFDCNGFVTGEDFDSYVAAFELGSISADFDGDGFVTGEDFDAFVVAFEAGC